MHRSGSEGPKRSEGRRRAAKLFREEFGPLYEKLFCLINRGAEGEIRQPKPLLADRVGLKPRITEGHERAMGFVAAFSRARDEKDFREWPSQLAATPAPSARLDSLPHLEGAAFAPTLECVADNVAPAGFGQFPDMERAVRRACDVKRMPRPSRAFSLVKTRRFAMSALSLLGNPSLSRSGPAASTTIRKVSGSPRYRLPMAAAMTNTGPLAGTRALHVEHVFAAIGALSQAAFRVVAHSAVDGDRLGSRERRWSRGLRRRYGREEG